MILQELYSYYDVMSSEGRVALPGWGATKVSYALDLNEEGHLLRIVPISTQSSDGKKALPRILSLPAPVKRASGIAPNFLWDSPAYLLGIDGKGDPKRAIKCFEASKIFHKTLLEVSKAPFALAISRFFDEWNAENADDCTLLTDCIDDLRKGVNLTCLFNSHFPAEDTDICKIWQDHYDKDNDGEMMRCLITGKEAVPEYIHPSIKGVVGAQSSGAALCSYNAPAFCSFGRKQNFNAPVSKYAAFAYTTALNALLSDSNHVRRFGDTTVVFWSKDAQTAYQDALSAILDGESDDLSDNDLLGYVNSLVNGNVANWKEVPLNPSQPFFMLGISPNAARLSVRFFLRNTFGNFAKNLMSFYDDTAIVSDNRSTGIIPLWRLLRETVNPNSNDKTPSPQMSGDMLRAILAGASYPATIYQQAQLRIRAQHNPTRGLMAIVKAYLLRINGNNVYREALTVELNEGTSYQPYVLGRLFAVLESIQRAANPGVNTTVRDKYFTSACATPALVFPTLMNLAQKHLRKLNDAQEIYFSKQITQLTSIITSSYPSHHNLYEQGVFQLGYYHQVQKIFTKKDRIDTDKEEK